MEVLKAINATLAFALELGMYAAYAMWGYSLGRNSVVHWLAAIGVPLAVAVLWGLFAAPKAAYRLGQPQLFIVELVLLLLAAALLYKLGHATWAIVFAVLALVSQVAALALKQ